MAKHQIGDIVLYWEGIIFVYFRLFSFIFVYLVAIISHGIFAFDITPDWNSKKVERMRAVVRAKFSQNIELREKLVATSGKTLIEESITDAFWGIGKKGKGKNWLGTILMQVREELK